MLCVCALTRGRIIADCMRNANVGRGQVAEYIRRTAKHHGQGQAEGDLAVFLDLDLSILGAKPCKLAPLALNLSL